MSNPICPLCNKNEMRDYADQIDDMYLNDPLYNNTLGHWWLCSNCDIDEIRELNYDPPEPIIYDWNGNRVIY